jgi:hypothetical protein
VLAATEAVGGTFRQYVIEGNRNGWTGVPIPSDSKVLSTVLVVRDDSATTFQFLEGDYDEYRSDGEPTGGTIRVKQRAVEEFETEARNKAGRMEWTGSIKIQLSSTLVQAEGFYRYSDSTESGRHLVSVDAYSGNIKVEGTNLSHPGGAHFETVWKRRP